jgi:hypothetical protein
MPACRLGVSIEHAALAQREFIEYLRLHWGANELCALMGLRVDLRIDLPPMFATTSSALTQYSFAFSTGVEMSEDIGNSALLEAVRALLPALESTRVHTWHSKETAHASLLALLTASDARYADPKRLIRAYAQVYSQHCEDGFIAEIFARIGTRKRTFLEIGVEDGQQNTTRFLLEQGWRGIWVEGNATNAEKARATFATYIARGSLQIIAAKVTIENVNKLLDDAGAPAEFDLISVDIDQNTTHVWRALNRRSRVACIEYNASLPPSTPLEVPYDGEASWDGTNWYGGSLKTVEMIGQDKGLSLVGCDPVGVNAYLVSSKEAVGHFCEPFTAENHYELPKYSLTTHIGHRPSIVAREWI